MLLVEVVLHLQHLHPLHVWVLTRQYTYICVYTRICAYVYVYEREYSVYDSVPRRGGPAPPAPPPPACECFMFRLFGLLTRIYTDKYRIYTIYIRVLTRLYSCMYIYVRICTCMYVYVRSRMIMLLVEVVLHLQHLHPLHASVSGSGVQGC